MGNAFSSIGALGGGAKKTTAPLPTHPGQQQQQPLPEERSQRDTTPLSGAKGSRGTAAHFSLAPGEQPTSYK